MPFINFGRPGAAALEQFVTAQRTQPVTFQGALVPTPGFKLTRTLAPLGGGEEVFALAVQGLEAWAVYPPWMTLYPRRAPLQENVVVALLTGVSPVWTLSAVRIVAVNRTPQQFSFTLGTLPQHAVSGSERFCVFLDERERVWYEIAALSKPQQPLVKLGASALRLIQRRFVKDSVRSLTSFCEGAK